MIRLGPFDLWDEPHARGGMGVVWAGEHRGDGARVAVKVLEAGGDRDLAALLDAEVRAAAILDHPNVVTVWDRGVVDARSAAESGGRLVRGTPWYAMEFVGGGVLSWKRPWSWPEARNAVVHLLSGLAHAHARGVLHRDIKPGNVLFTESGGRGVLKLSDFGMGWRFVADPRSETPVGGTPQYMAPEQFAGDPARQGPWTDLYAVGCLLFALLCGRHAYRGTFLQLRDQHLAGSFPALAPRVDVPAGLASVLGGLVAVNAGDRYARAADVIADLLALPDAEPALDEPMAQYPSEEPSSAPTLIVSDPLPTLPIRRGSRPPPAPAPARWPKAQGRGRMPPGVGLGLFALRSLPFVGRAVERERLWASLLRVRTTRRPHLVVLGGPRGVGKTRLAEWLAEAADETGAAVVLRGSSASGEARAGFAGPVAVHYRVPPGLSSEAVVAWLLRASSVDGLQEDDARSLAVLLGPNRVTGRDAARSSPADRANLLARFSSRVAGQRAVVFWMADVDHDRDTLQIVLRLLHTEGLPVLLVLTTTTPLDLGSERVEEIELSPLSSEDSRALVEALLPVGPELVDRVEERVSGDPLLARQLVGHWVERGWLTAAITGFSLASEALAASPPSLAELWEQRIEGIVGGDRRRDLLLLVAATLGRAVDVEEWAEVARRLGLPPPDTFLTLLVDAGLGRSLPDQPGTFLFSHGLFVEAVVRRRDPADRAAAHRVVGDALQGERRGLHWFEAGDKSEAFPLLIEATAVRVRLGQPDTALMLLDRLASFTDTLGPTDPRSVEVVIERAQALRMSGALEAARALAEAAAGVPVADPVLRIKVLRELSVLLQYTATDPRVETLLDEAFVLAGSDVDQLVPLWVQRARALDYQGKLEAAQAAYLEARRLLPGGSTNSAATEVVMGLASLAHKLGDLDRALPLAREAMAAFEAQGLAYHAAWSEVLVGEVLRALGDLEGAEALYRRSIERYGELSPAQTSMPRLNLSAVLAARGRFDEALREASIARRDADRSGHTNLARMSVVFAARAAAGAGEWAVFDELLPLASELAEHGLFDPDLLQLAEAAGQLASAAGRDAAAEQLFRIAHTQAVALGLARDVSRLDARLQGQR